MSSRDLERFVDQNGLAMFVGFNILIGLLEYQLKSHISVTLVVCSYVAWMYLSASHTKLVYL